MSTESSAVSETRSTTILVVDDNPGTLYATSRILMSAGFAVAQATTGESAVGYAASRKPVDLVVLDVNLPDLDGFEVCRRIRANTPDQHIPVIYLSASFVTDVDKVTGFEAGADGYLTHPVDPTVLIATVKAFLRARQTEIEREDLLERERVAREQAERANRAKDEFLATLSHELRSPLNAIIGWSEVLRANPSLNKDALDAVNVIVRNARFQAQLISDLLDVSRITAGKLDLAIEPVDARDLMEEVIRLLHPAAQVRRIGVTCSIGNDVAWLRGDSARLKQIVSNLVSNAIKFSPEGAEVTIAVTRVDGQAEISVTDQGRGISKEDMPRIFDRFWQQDTSSRRVHTGLGLGLAIVRSLTELHGGTVNATSDGLGKGARFSVTIPTVSEAEARHLTTMEQRVPEPTPQPTPMPRLEGMTVLLVDDDSDARHWVRRLLTDLGANVEEAGDVAEALMFLDQTIPDVMISDLAMPRQDGFDLVKLLRGRGIDAKTLPAIALSAFASELDRANAIAAGYQIFLSKPPEPRSVVEAVAQLRS
jgi:signal transduction histidine kinase